MLMVMTGCNNVPNDQSVLADNVLMEQADLDSLFSRFQRGEIFRSSIISLIEGENILVNLPLHDGVLWIDSAGTMANDKTMRSLMDNDMRQLHIWIWSLDEMRQHKVNNVRRGLYAVATDIYPVGDSTWYQVEVMRDYFYKNSPASPFGFLLVNPTTKQIIVRDPVLGDVPMDEWRLTQSNGNNEISN